MKKTIKKSTQLDNILGFTWALIIVIGCTYIVFWKGASGWWYLMAIVFLQADAYYYKETIEE
jgi:membrane protein YdbS with pleckstrin-like domain